MSLKRTSRGVSIVRIAAVIVFYYSEATLDAVLRDNHWIPSAAAHTLLVDSVEQVTDGAAGRGS